VVRRVLLAFVFGLLIWDASGLDALVTTEQCVDFTDSLPDNTCPSTCVRCACGQPIVTTIVNSVTASFIKIPFLENLRTTVPARPPHDIFHIPKSISLTL